MRTAPGRTPVPQHRFHALDAMRGIAAVLVMIYHLPTSLHTIFPNSYLVVDLFFVLSGFVIGYSYEERLKTRMSLRTFTVARIVRLYPLYLIGTLVGVFDLALHAFHMHDRSFLANLPILASAILFLPNLLARQLSPDLYPLDGPAWSLFFELIANIAYAVLLRARLASVSLLLCLALLSFAWLAATPDSSNSGWSFATFWPAFARVGYSFFVGVLLCRLFRTGIFPTLTGRAAWTTMLALCAVVCLCVAVHVSVAHARIFSLFVTAMLFPAIVLLGAACSLPRSWQRLCNFLGDSSYPLYTIHSPTFYLIVLAAHFRQPWFSTLVTVTLLVLLVPLSWFLGKYIDLPTRKYLMASLTLRTPERLTP